MTIDSGQKYAICDIQHFMAADMMRQGIPEKMIKAGLKDLAAHVMDQTLEGYLHVAAPNAARAVVRSPIEDL